VARWQQTGSPIVPSLVVDGTAMPILHVSQIASALGLPPPTGDGTAAVAWDLVSILEAWRTHLAAVDWETVLAPTPSRGRSLRNLTVNTFHPVELLPGAWARGEFDWNPDDDAEREQALADAPAVCSYAERIAGIWNDFVLETGDGLSERDPVVTSPRGEVPFSDLLASQRWHAAYHYRQVVAFLGSHGVRLDGAVAVEQLAAIGLPADVF
jgi:hypothetical protein